MGASAMDANMVTAPFNPMMGMFQLNSPSNSRDIRDVSQHHRILGSPRFRIDIFTPGVAPAVRKDRIGICPDLPCSILISTCKYA